MPITINEIETDTDLIGIIQDQLLPEISGEALRTYIQSNASSICVIFDGYDEATDNFHQITDIRNVLRSRWLVDTCVIVTTRPNEVGKFCERYGPCTQVEIQGFSKRGRKLYVENFFQISEYTKRDNEYVILSTADITAAAAAAATDDDDNDDDRMFSNSLRRYLRRGKQYIIDFFQTHGPNHDDDDDNVDGDDDNSSGGSCDGGRRFLKNLGRSPRLYQLSIIPIILSMLCLLWAEDATFPSSVTALYKDIIVYLGNHAAGKGTNDNIDMSDVEDWVDKVLFVVGKVAIQGLFEDQLVFKATDFQTDVLEQACLLGVAVKERKRSRLRVTYSVVFLHKTFQEFCAAVYWSHLADTDRRKFDQHLRQITGNNVFEMEYLLRFACGLSVKATEIILPYVVQIMCHHYNRLKNHCGEICDICENVCQKLPIFLLHEAESNNSDVKESYILHSLLKLLYNTIVLHTKGDTEFYHLFLPYAALSRQNKGDITQINRPWLCDVEHVYVYASRPASELCRALLSGFSQIANLIDQCNVSELPSCHKAAELEVENSERDRNTPGTGRGAGTLQIGLLNIKYLDMGWIEIGESIENLPQAYKYMPHLRRLDLEHTSLKPSHCAVLFDGFIAAGKMTSQQNEMSSDAQVTGPGAPQSGLSIEHLVLSENDIAESVEKLAQAYKYMPSLRWLYLDNTNLNPSHCAVLFDGFIAADKMLSQQDEMSSDAQVSGSGESQNGLSIEHLYLSENDIGESVEKLVQAYKYMPTLRRLYLRDTNLNPSHCALLFDAFIAAGKMASQQDRMNSDAQVSRSGVSQRGLSIEHLDLSCNHIGKSVEKLAQAYKHMPRLIWLALGHTNLDPSHCAVLLDGFIAAGRSQQYKMSSDAQFSGSGASQGGLSIEVLDLSGNHIGESVVKFVQAYKYMSHLKWLSLLYTNLNPFHCAVLFDGFIAAGKMLSQDEMSSDSQVSGPDASQNGLSIEHLYLQGNDIGGHVDKLILALRYMSNLTYMTVRDCGLYRKSLRQIHETLKSINCNFHWNIVFDSFRAS